MLRTLLNPLRVTVTETTGTNPCRYPLQAGAHLSTEGIMTHSELHDAAHRMVKQGGSFAAAIAEAYFAADKHNRERLLQTFGDLFERFKATNRGQQS